MEDNENKKNNRLCEESKFLDNLTVVVDELCTSFNLFLENVHKQNTLDIKQIDLIRSQSLINDNKYLNILNSDTKEDVPQDGLQQKSKASQTQIDSPPINNIDSTLEIELEKKQNEIDELKKQLINQNSFTTKMGAILGNLLWKSCKSSETVDIIITGDNLYNLLDLIDETLVSFLDTFKNSIPSNNTNELKFILSLCGTLTNIFAQPHGRSFFLSLDHGNKLIDKILMFIDFLPIPSGSTLKRMFLMMIYNLSINKSGLSYIHNNFNGIKNIIGCLQPPNSPDIQLLGLRILSIVFTEMPNKSMFIEIKKMITENELQIMYKTSTEPQFQKIIDQILYQFDKLNKEFLCSN